MKKIFIFLGIITFFSNISYAQYGGFDAGTLNRQYVQDLRTHEAITRARQHSAIVTPKTGTQLPKEVTNVNIKSITFVNNNSIPSAVLNNIVKDKLNQPMNAENVAAIRRDIMKFYQDQGYFSALAMVVSQDSQTGELTIEIREGTKNSIQIQD